MSHGLADERVRHDSIPLRVTPETQPDLEQSGFLNADIDLGCAAIRVEAPEGRAKYVRAQRTPMAQGQLLRGRLAAALEPLSAAKVHGG